MADVAPAAPTLDDFIEQLKDAAPQLRKKAHSSLYGYDMDDVIVSAVEANTIRGFNPKKLGLKTSPLDIYRDWASDFVMWAGYADFTEIADRDGFEAFYRRARLSCERAFQKQGANATLTYGQTAKVTDLLLKRLVRFPEIKDDVRIHLTQFLHVPLEKVVLLAIRDFDVTDISGKRISIPKSATMSFVEREEMYYALQAFLTAVAETAEVPPVLIDYMLSGA